MRTLVSRVEKGQKVTPVGLTWRTVFVLLLQYKKILAVIVSVAKCFRVMVSVQLNTKSQLSLVY